MSKDTKRRNMVNQTILIFAISVILISTVSSAALYAVASYTVTHEISDHAEAAAGSLKDYIEQYPAHEWLLQYWHDNYSDLDIEYDVSYENSIDTANKAKLLTKRHPDFLLQYATTGEVQALPPEDQILYAEIVYSWLITFINSLAIHYDIDFLFCNVVEEPYDKSFFLFIASNKDRTRGYEHGELYPIGTILANNPEQMNAIKGAVSGKTISAHNDDGRYSDHFFHLASIENREFLIGVTHKYTYYMNAIRFAILIYGLLFISCFIALAAVCILRLRASILHPLRNIQKSIRLYRDTKDSKSVIKSLAEVQAHNELAQLSDDVADLAKEIDHYTKRITAITSERERIETELSLASRIQSAMLPSKFPAYPDRKEFEIFASMNPARVVGGDFYDFILVDDRYLYVVMADVSGKGIPAAFFMMACMITLSDNIRQNKSPAEICREANDSICPNNPEEMFVTVWIGKLDLTTGKLVAANAGHEKPVLMRPGGDFELISQKHDFVIGGMDNINYHETETVLEPGSKLFLYTDGLPEATDAGDNMFGTERMVEVLNRCKENAPEDILRSMKESVDKFTNDADQFDDLTMLCLEFNGPADTTVLH